MVIRKDGMLVMAMRASRVRRMRRAHRNRFGLVEDAQRQGYGYETAQH
jgi:hypothetical protein